MERLQKGGRGKAGGGAVFRENMGAFRAGMCHHFPNIVDPETAEVLACKQALQVEREMDVQKVHVELDSQGVVHMLQQRTKNLSAAGPLVEEIKGLLNSFSESRVSWVSRSANVGAHKFARVGLGDELCRVWLGAPPDFVLDILSDEIPNFTI